MVADAAGDVTAIADHLGLGRFAVYGISGGGPHALAVAALAGDRVSRAACIVGVAPLQVLGDEFFSGMDPQNVTEWRWALEGEQRLTEELERTDRQWRQQAAADPAGMLADFGLPESDRAVMSRRDWAKVMRESVIEQTRKGIWGWADDLLAFVSGWGFDPAEIAVPTLVWYGTQDVLSPPRHGQWIASTVPGATVWVDALGAHGQPGRRSGQPPRLADQRTRRQLSAGPLSH